MGDDNITNQYREILDQNIHIEELLKQMNEYLSKKHSFFTFAKSSVSTAAGAAIGGVVAGPVGAAIGGIVGATGSLIHSLVILKNCDTFDTIYF